MKIMHEQVNFPQQSNIKAKETVKERFTYPWHFHSQMEILYIIEGKGTRFVGDSIHPIAVGEVSIIGSNLPHFWKSDDITNSDQGSQENSTHYITIQFPADFMTNAITNYLEFTAIKRVIHLADRGLNFSKSQLPENFHSQIESVVKANGFKRIIKLLELLNLLAEIPNYKLLAGEYYQHEYHTFSNSRLEVVIQYINKHYREDIRLADVAKIANMNTSSFSRFFKEKSSRTFIEYVNDLRIGYASTLVIENKMSISQICFESGFNNISNFNHAFKRHIGSSPTKYRARFL